MTKLLQTMRTSQVRVPCAAEDARRGDVALAAGRAAEYGKGEPAPLFPALPLL